VPKLKQQIAHEQGSGFAVGDDDQRQGYQLKTALKSAADK